MKLNHENLVDFCKRGAMSLCWLPAIAAGEKDAYILTSRDLLFLCKCDLSVALVKTGHFHMFWWYDLDILDPGSFDTVGLITERSSGL